MLRSRHGAEDGQGLWRHSRFRSIHHHTTTQPFRLFLILLLLVVSNNPRYCSVAAATAMTELVDASTGKLQSIPGQATAIVTVIPSPGSPCRLLGTSNKEDASRVVLLASAQTTTRSSSSDNVALLVCRGATLTDDNDAVGRCLALCGTVSDCLVVDGITLGDVELRHSRHARTLSALFRGRLLLMSSDDSIKQGQNQPQRQTLILSVQGYDPNRDPAFADAVQQDLEALFKATVAEGKQPTDSFLELYDLSIVPADLAEQVRMIFGCMGSRWALLGWGDSNVLTPSSKHGLIYIYIVFILVGNHRF